MSRRPRRRVRSLRRPVPLGLELRLWPAAADRAALAAWPAEPLAIDFMVAAAGTVTLAIGEQVVAYRRGQLVPLLPGEAPPADAAVPIPEYLPAFADALAAVLPWLEAPGGPAAGSRWAGMAANSAGLGFEAAAGGVEVAYRESVGGAPIYRARLPADQAARVIRAALHGYVAQLLAVNPRLREHPAVSELIARLR